MLQGRALSSGALTGFTIYIQPNVQIFFTWSMKRSNVSRRKYKLRV